MSKPTYLGDGVYVDFDGFHFWLTTNNGYPDDPRNQIALEPEVYAALVRFADEIHKLQTEMLEKMLEKET